MGVHVLQVEGVDFGVVCPHWPNGFNVVLIVYVAPSSVLSVYYDKISLKFASCCMQFTFAKIIKFYLHIQM